MERTLYYVWRESFDAKTRTNQAEKSSEIEMSPSKGDSDQHGKNKNYKFLLTREYVIEFINSLSALERF